MFFYNGGTDFDTQKIFPGTKIRVAKFDSKFFTLDYVMDLTKRQKRFCKEYLIDLNGTQAAIRAGYSERTANVISCQLLTKLNIQEKIQQEMQERSERTDITQDKVLRELARIGFTDMKDYASWSGDNVKLVDSTLLTSDQTAAVAEICQTVSKDGGSIKFKLHDKVSALEKIGKHLGMFKESIVIDDFKIQVQLIGGKDDKGRLENQ